MKLKKWGWDTANETEFSYFKEQGLIAGRIVLESKHLYEVETEAGRKEAKVSGHFRYTAVRRSDFPTIGDWVALRIEENQTIIEHLLKRKSSFSRKTAGIETDEQIIAANIDILFIVLGLDGGRNFSAGGLERYLARALDSGSTPVVILNKADLCEDPEEKLFEAETSAPDAPVHVTSAMTGEGLDVLSGYLTPGKTAAFTGPSGVGKSALINALFGEEKQLTGSIRDSDLRGRHTTTRKELFLLPSGGILIDSPGLKELQLWGDEESLNETFSEITEFAENCKFRDCSHQNEPGCAVQQALAEGAIDHRRFENYLDMKRELRFLESRQTEKRRLEAKAKDKRIAKFLKKNYQKK
jgi:ribosome biogenesis GTPase